MPKRTIYIRNDDLDKFESIADFPTWLHKCLQGDLRSRDELLQIAHKTISWLQRRVARLEKQIKLKRV